jgi:hypothetical protein
MSLVASPPFLNNASRLLTTLAPRRISNQILDKVEVVVKERIQGYLTRLDQSQNSLMAE